VTAYLKKTGKLEKSKELGKCYGIKETLGRIMDSLAVSLLEEQEEEDLA